MNRREIERMLDAIGRARAAGERVALATVIRVRGSAYRREGAHSVIRENGTYECLLSGGCLEPSVADAALQVIHTGQPVTLEYDLADDSVFGLSIGCSGVVDIRIEPIGDDPVTTAWLDAIAREEWAALITELETADGRSGRLLIRHDDVSIGSLSSPALQAAALRQARELRAALGSRSGVARIEGRDVFIEVSEPPSRLVIFGAGPDAEPLARQAWDLGFSVTVVDVRDAFLTTSRFPHATLIASHFADFADRVALDDRTFVVVMNHHLERDRESLRFALSSRAPYIGLLGPRSRYDRLVAGLAAQYGQGWMPSPASLSRVRSPIGLALGAEAAEEIALSILGELLALQRGFDAGFLNGRESGLHDPRDVPQRVRD